MISFIKQWAAKLKQQIIVLHLAMKDPLTPWYANTLIFLIIAYALSPIDLIPDFIPILGLLDDLILLPIAIYFAVKLIPEKVIKNARLLSLNYRLDKQKSLFGTLIVIFLWIATAFTLFILLSKK